MLCIGCTYLVSEYNKYLYNIHKNDIHIGTIRLWGLQEVYYNINLGSLSANSIITLVYYLLHITVNTAAELDSLIVLYNLFNSINFDLYTILKITKN